MRYISLREVLALHEQIISETGGGTGVRDLGALESAISQPRAAFDGKDLYTDLIAKASTLGFGLVANHPVVDGNKRIGHAAMEVLLVLNGQEIMADVDEQERIILAVAAGEMDREKLEDWLRGHVKPFIQTG